MFLIYGKEGCPFCEKAVELAEDKKLPYTYIDIVRAGISKEQLQKIVGQDVTTVPQILVDGIYIGDYTKFKEEYDKGSDKA